MVKGFICGVLATVFVLVLARTGHFGFLMMFPNICGKDQDGIICTQQWLSSVGPAIALGFAAWGSVQVGKQLKQGQSAVASNERSQLRTEYEVISSLRDELDDHQRGFEGFDALYKDGITLPVSTTWDELEKLQYVFDGYVEWLDEIAREPYLIQHRKFVQQLRRRASRRSEAFREAAALWDDHKRPDAFVAKAIELLRKRTYPDIHKLRVAFDRDALAIGRQIAKLLNRQI